MRRPQAGAGQDSLLALPLGSVSSLEVRRQKTMALRGAGIGLVSGAMFGLATGASEVIDVRYITVPLFGLAAAGIGALIGHHVKIDRWETVPLDRLRVGIVPQRGGGLAVGFNVRR